MNSQTKTPVVDTWWAEADRERFGAFVEGMAEVLPTTEALWQLRVDRGAETPFAPHEYLHLIEALEYGIDDQGRNAPTGKEYTMLAMGTNSREAGRKVLQVLKDHGLGENWMLRSGRSLLVLS